jgi:hypothetical protein
VVVGVVVVGVVVVGVVVVGGFDAAVGKIEVLIEYVSSCTEKRKNMFNADDHGLKENTTSIKFKFKM